MIPRTLFDIGWSDLAYGFTRHYVRGDRQAAQQQLEEHWSPAGDTLACLSLRSGFDVALEAYDFEPGGEVLMSCMNIGPMAEIVQDRGLTPVAIDLDMDTLQMRAELLEQAVNSKTRAIVHAHVLGTRYPLDELRAFADKHNLVLIEDGAQAYRGDSWRGDSQADVSLFSFGPLKTCSATMGGLVQFRDWEVLSRARELQAQRPVQSRYQFIDRLGLFAELLFCTRPVPYTVVANVAARLGLSELINTPVRNFRGRNQLTKLRKQPGFPLLALMLRRLRNYDADLVRRRIAAGELLLEQLPGLRRPGRHATDHGHWLFPICVDDPAELRRRLQAAGFDSTLGHKAFVVLDPPADRPEFTPTEAIRYRDQSLYLPIHYGLTDADVLRMADVIAEYDPSTRVPQEEMPATAESASVRQVEAVSS